MKKTLSTILFALVLAVAIAGMCSCDNNATDVHTESNPIEEPTDKETDTNGQGETNSEVSTDATLEQHVHIYDEKNVESTYLKSNATCVSQAVYYYSCACGEKGTNTFATGNKNGNHTGSSKTGYLYLDDATHEEIIYCSDCYEILKTSTKNHMRSSADICSWCETSPAGLYHTLKGDEAEYNYVALTKSWNELISDQIIVIDENKSVSVAEGMDDELDGYLVMGDGVEKIGKYGFSGCGKLQGIIISEGVTTIEAYAFNNCFELKDVSIPRSVNSIGYKAFYVSVSGDLTNVYISDIAAWCEIYFGGEYSNPLEYASNIYVNNVLTNELIIPNGIESIGDRAFYGAPITSLTIPASVREIGGAAFYGCEELVSVTFENGSQLQKYGHHAFGACEKLVYNEYDNAYYIGSRDNPYLILIKATDEEITSCEIHSDTKLIATYAFIGCNDLKTISMSEGITFIGNCAFQWTNTAPSTTAQYLRIVFGGKKAQWQAIEYQKSSLEIAYIVVCTNGNIASSELENIDN